MAKTSKKRSGTGTTACKTKMQWLQLKLRLANAQSDLSLALVGKDWLGAGLAQTGTDAVLVSMKRNPRFKYFWKRRSVGRIAKRA